MKCFEIRFFFIIAQHAAEILGSQSKYFQMFMRLTDAPSWLLIKRAFDNHWADVLKSKEFFYEK